MTINIQSKENQIFIELIGSLDTLGASDFLQAIRTLPETEEMEVLIDGAKMNYISSSGLRAFNILHKRIGKVNGKLAVKNLIPEVLNIFQITGFNKIITIFHENC